MEDGLGPKGAGLEKLALPSFQKTRLWPPSRGGDKEIEKAVAVEGGGDDDGRRLGGERRAIRKGPGAVVETDETGSRILGAAAIGGEDVGMPVAIEVGEGDVASGPVRVAELAR